MKNKLLLTATVVTLLSFPNVNFGQAPDLGTSAGFSLFTASGAFTNLGATTNITGDIGTNAGAFDFTGGTENGNIYLPGSPVAAQAAIDVDSAYIRLNGITCGSVIGITLGGGQILTPGVYCQGAASTLNGDLILDGQDDPNAVFIFKIGGALSTGTHSNVILTGSASWCNVYWQINGQFDLGDSSVFRGTIVANGAINLLEGAYLEGRGLSRMGVISLHNNTVEIPAVILLPVTLVSFNAEKCDTKTSVNLNWQTASEFNSEYFIIERSTDGIDFKKIGVHNAAGYSAELLSYFFTDENPAQGINYYRLNQFDRNGTHDYSPVKAVSFSNTVLAVNIFPNPFSTSIGITLNNASQINNCELRIYDVLGAEVINTILSGQVTTLETSALPSGNYFYKVIGNDTTIQSGKLISRQ